MNGELTINNVQTEAMPVSIVDMQGRILYNAALAPGQTRISVANWASGTYLLQVSYQGQRYAKKLLK
jgi:hypothetical protein